MRDPRKGNRERLVPRAVPEDEEIPTAVVLDHDARAAAAFVSLVRLVAGNDLADSTARLFAEVDIATAPEVMERITERIAALQALASGASYDREVFGRFEPDGNRVYPTVPDTVQPTSCEECGEATCPRPAAAQAMEAHREDVAALRARPQALHDLDDAVQRHIARAAAEREAEVVCHRARMSKGWPASWVVAPAYLERLRARLRVLELTGEIEGLPTAVADVLAHAIPGGPL